MAIPTKTGNIWDLLDKETFDDKDRISTIAVVCEPGKELPFDYLEQINYLENEEMVNVFYGEPLNDNKLHGLVYDINVREYNQRDFGGTNKTKIMLEGHETKNIMEY